MTLAGRFASRRDAEEARLVLNAADMPAWLQPAQGQWDVLVDPDMGERARRELEAWKQERAERTRQLAQRPRVDGARRARAGFAAFLWCVVLIWFHVMSLPRREAWLAAAAADGVQIRAGQVERAMTALTLHADLEHVAGNSFFGALFLFALATECGAGAAVLLAFASGAAGNLLNAWLLQGDRLGIGASTAVFGMLGVLAGVRILQWTRDGRGWRALLLPAAGLLAMLAWLGTAGQDTDIGAHLLGAAAGVPLALPTCVRPRLLETDPVQWTAAALTAGLLATSWFLALT